MMEDLRGRLLIANGNLFDPNFRQAVVLVVEHGEQGALGIVLNRPADVAVAEAVPALAPAVDPDEVLYLGGPVQPTAVVLLARFIDGEGVAHPLFERVGLVTGEVESLASTERARVFAGYAGWGAGQLEREMEENSWIVATPTTSDVFTSRPATLWADVLARQGGEYRLLARMPPDPSLN
jgi:putative transcriptional regulator